MDNYIKELDTAKDVANEAGKIMLKYFDADQHIEIKKDNSEVTIADKLINSFVIKQLSKVFPADGVIGEEESTSGYGMGRKWFCDPIDGTKAYVWGVPTAMFSLGLVIDGKPVAGVIYDPFLDKMYSGSTGAKSFCNGKELFVSKLDLAHGTVATSSNPQSHTTQSLIEDHLRVACFSGAVYKCSLVARGRFVAFIEDGVNGHDLAAAHIIVEGAGGKVTGRDGKPLDYSKPFQGAIASNGIVHEELVKYQ